MFYLTLPLALILVATAHVAARRHPRPVRWGLFLTVGLALHFTHIPYVDFGPVVTLYLFGTLVVALMIWSFIRKRTTRFYPLSVLAVVVAYAWPVAEGVRRQAEHNASRDRYPFEAMADRMPEPNAAYRPTLLSTAAASRLGDLDNVVDSEARTSNRIWRLRVLHSGTLDLFVNSPGFGERRMSVFGSSDAGLQRYREVGDRAQPGSRSGSDDFLSTPEIRTKPDGLMAFHDRNVVEFVNPKGFGLVEKRTRVAGFAGHGFGRLPLDRGRWSIETVELVSRLLHPHPVVYESDLLPAMDELKTAPTRKPDEFEAAALERIRKGDDLVTAETEDGTRMRMLGSIRNGNTCQKCHGGDRGDLLGAFSYVLSRK